MAKTFTFPTAGAVGYAYITTAGGTTEDPITFNDIWQYYQDNPMVGEWDMPQRYGGSPYELCENNADEWSGINGMDTPADDGVDYTKNSYSISSEVVAVPTPDTSCTSIVPSSDRYINFYLPDSSSYAVGEHIMVEGTTNFDGIYLLDYVSTGIIRSYHPSSVPDDAATEIFTGGCTISKPLCIAWNDDKSENGFAYPQAQKFKFSAKSDGTGSPKFKGVAIRNLANTTTEAGRIYGISGKKDFALTSTWADFELNIRDDMSMWLGFANAGSARGYFNNGRQIYMFFDGVTVGEKIWIDGVRLNLEDRNPKKIGYNSFIFPTGIYNGDCFRDKGFYVQFDALESFSGNNTIAAGASLFTLYTTTEGNSQLGNYNYSDSRREGGIINVDLFCREDTGTYLLTNVLCQGITFLTPPGTWGGYHLTGIYNTFRDCNFINCINLMSSTNFIIKGGAWMGGRYFIAFATGTIVDGLTIYGVGCQFYARHGLNQDDYKNVKIIDDTATKVIISSDSYAGSTNTYNPRWINFDISECNNPRVSINNVVGYGDRKIELEFAITANLHILDVDNNNLVGAIVTISDKDGNLLVNETTDVNGQIDEQTLNIFEIYNPNIGRIAPYFDSLPTANVRYHYPFTLTISKVGYETYNQSILSGVYDRNNQIMKEGFNWTIVLKEQNKTRKDIEGNLYLAIHPETGSSAKIIKL